MIDKSTIYDGKIEQTAEGSCYAIFSLCRIGIASGDSAMSIDLSQGGYDALFEAIATLAEDAIQRIEKERRERAKDGKTCC